MENVKLINKYLERTYGRALDNKPKFRVVWSEDLFEVRKGLFSPGATIEEIKRVPKYSYIQDKYILEVYTLAFPSAFGKALQHSVQIIMDGDKYEPLRVFRTRKGVYLPPDMEVCKIICDAFVELINRPEGKRLTEKQATYDDVQAMRKETAKFEEMLNADDWELTQKFAAKEAVALPGKEFS